MSIPYLAFNGIAWIASFVVIHLVVSRLLNDPTDIDFRRSIVVACIPSILLYYGIPIGESTSLWVLAAVVVGSILVAWKVIDQLTVLDAWPGLLASFAVNASYLAVFLSLRAVWWDLLEVDGT